MLRSLGDAAGWYAAADVPLGRGEAGLERIQLPPQTSASALRLWFTQPAKTTGVRITEVRVRDGQNRSLTAIRATASASRGVHLPSHAIDGDLATHWSCQRSTAAVDWLALHFRQEEPIDAIEILWENPASMYRVDVRGPCRETPAMLARGASCSAAAGGERRRRPFHVVVRTSAMRIAQADLVRVLARLTAQLRPSEVTLLVDTTICAGLACNASWVGEHLGVAAQAYSVRDVVERWPAARWQERLLGLGTADANASRHDVEVGCWAAQRVAMWLDALLGLPWPHVRGGGAPPPRFDFSAAVGAHSMLLPFLVHEPSIVLWWEARRRQRKGAGQQEEEDVWVLEDDVAFTGNAAAWFDAQARSVDADLVSVFQPFQHECRRLDEARPLAEMGRRADELLRRPCEPPEGSPRDAMGGDSRALWPVHKWEHIERLSPRLLGALRRALDRGVTAHGEIFGSSLCAAHDWCTSADLRESGAIRFTNPWTWGDAKMEPTSRRFSSSRSRWQHVDFSTARRYADGQTVGTRAVAATPSAAQLADAFAPLSALLRHALHQAGWCRVCVVWACDSQQPRGRGTTASERQACERTCGAHPSLRGFRCDGIEGASAACSPPTSGAAAEATAAAVLDAIDREVGPEKRVA